MTETMIDLPNVIAKSDDSDFLREPIQDAAQRLMDIEVAAVCGAGHGERSPDRENQRNDDRLRQWDTRAGAAVGGGETASWLYETGTAANALFGIRDETANAWLYSVTVDLATLSITPFAGTGRARVIDRGVGPNGGRLLEIHVTASAVAGNVTGAWVYPTGTTLNTDTAILHHAQHERLPSATSPNRPGDGGCGLCRALC